MEQQRLDPKVLEYFEILKFAYQNSSDDIKKFKILFIILAFATQIQGKLSHDVNDVSLKVMIQKYISQNKFAEWSVVSFYHRCICDIQDFFNKGGKIDAVKDHKISMQPSIASFQMREQHSIETLYAMQLLSQWNDKKLLDIFNPPINAISNSNAKNVITDIIHTFEKCVKQYINNNNNVMENLGYLVLCNLDSIYQVIEDMFILSEMANQFTSVEKKEITAKQKNDKNRRKYEQKKRAKDKKKEEQNLSKTNTQPTVIQNTNVESPIESDQKLSQVYDVEKKVEQEEQKLPPQKKEQTKPQFVKDQLDKESSKWVQVSDNVFYYKKNLENKTINPKIFQKMKLIGDSISNNQNNHPMVSIIRDYFGFIPCANSKTLYKINSGTGSNQKRMFFTIQEGNLVFLDMCIGNDVHSVNAPQDILNLERDFINYIENKNKQVQSH